MSFTTVDFYHLVRLTNVHGEKVEWLFNDPEKARARFQTYVDKAAADCEKYDGIAETNASSVVVRLKIKYDEYVIKELTWGCHLITNLAFEQ